MYGKYIANVLGLPLDKVFVINDICLTVKQSTGRSKKKIKKYPHMSLHDRTLSDGTCMFTVTE